MEKQKPKPNLLIQSAQRKDEAQKKANHFRQFGKSHSSQARENGKSGYVPRGGRNGQGKP